MSYTKDKTKFRSSSYGVGIFRGYDAKHGTGVLCIEFPNRGIIKFAATAVKDGHLHLVLDEPVQSKPVVAPKPVQKIPEEKVVQEVQEKKIKSVADCIFSELVDEINVQAPNSTMIIEAGDTVIQYDTADTVIGDKNILEAFDCDSVMIFNESYIIIGDETSARKINATYDLTIVGSLTVDEIYVNGTLTVLGNLEARKIVCYNNMICQGDVSAEYIYVGKDLIADSIKCTEFSCYGNAVVRTTIDIDKSSRTRKTMIACEGIIGAGVFVALNAIANEYFEFDGDIHGRILELDTETVLSDIKLTVTAQSRVLPVQAVAIDQEIAKLPMDQVVKLVSDRLFQEYEQLNQYDQNKLLELTHLLSSSAIRDLNNVDTLLRHLTLLSSDAEINDIGDYLLIAYAKEKLPKQVYRHRCVEYVENVLRPKAEASLEDMEFIPSTVRKIAQSLYIIVQLEDALPLSADVLLDKVFSSIGLRFSTVQSIVSRVSVPKKDIPVAPAVIPEEVAPTVTIESETQGTSSNEGYKPNPVVAACENREAFLSKQLSVVGKSFTMTNDEVIRLGSVKIRTVGDFIAVDTAFIRDLYKKKPFLANHLISVLKKMKAASNHIT